MVKLSIIIPVYNEEKAIAQIIKSLKQELIKLNLNYELIIINDGSTDKTKEVLEKIKGIRLINHPHNKGNGAAIKTGVRNALYDYLLFFDGDGQHKPKYIKEFLKYANEYDLIAGARFGYRGPLIRQPGKKILHWLANCLGKQKIPDLNCGMRLFKKDAFSGYIHLLPDSFSLHTTITLLFIKDGLNVKFIPVEINKRIGKSTVKPIDAFRMFMLILRTILLFSPLRVFLPISSLFFVIAIVSVVYDIFFRPFNITDITILLLISSLLMFFFGLLADQVAAIRREIKR